MEIKVDTLIKELEKYKGKVITEIQILDINLKLELAGINKMIIDKRFLYDEEDEPYNEVTLVLDSR